MSAISCNIILQSCHDLVMTLQFLVLVLVLVLDKINLRYFLAPDM